MGTDGKHSRTVSQHLPPPLPPSPLAGEAHPHRPSGFWGPRGVGDESGPATEPSMPDRCRIASPDRPVSGGWTTPHPNPPPPRGREQSAATLQQTAEAVQVEGQAARPQLLPDARL